MGMGRWTPGQNRATQSLIACWTCPSSQGMTWATCPSPTAFPEMAIPFVVVAFQPASPYLVTLHHTHSWTPPRLLLHPRHRHCRRVPPLPALILPSPHSHPPFPSLHPPSASLRKPLLCICNAQHDDLQETREETIPITVLSKIINGGGRIFLANFLPSILCLAVLLGLVCPKLGSAFFEKGFTKWATFAVFLISGFTLKTNDLEDVMDAWPFLLFGVVSVLFLTPWIAVPILRLKLVPQELVTGLALFCCVPTTLSSGVSLTQAAGANTAIALSLTIISNTLGIFTVPIMVSKLVAPGIGISIPPALLMSGLVNMLLVPLSLGKVIQTLVPGSLKLVTEKKNTLSILSSFFLSLVPWMQVSHAHEKLLSLDLYNFSFAASLAIVVHFVFLLLNIFGMHILQSLNGGRSFQMKSTAWAIILTGSQKTLPIAIAIIGSMSGMMGEAGLLVLPCLIAHITQIICDSFLVRFFIEDDLKKLG